MNGDTQAAVGEEQLTALLALHQTALETMSHGLIMIDAAERVVLYNQRFLQMYGLSGEVVRVGAHIRDVIAHAVGQGIFGEERFEDIWKRRNGRIAERKPFSTRRPMTDGRTYALHYTPMPDGGWVTLCEDVSHRYAMERALRVQIERFDQAVSHMSHGLCMFGPDERLIVCNKQYLEIYGLDPDVIKPGVTHRELLAHWIAQGNEPGMTADGFYARRTLAVRGREVATMLLHLKSGRVVKATSRPTPNGGWVSAHEDVTERLHYEEVLREQNLLFDAAIENMPHGLCMYDRDLRVIVSNRRYREIYGLSADDARPGTPMLELMRTSTDRGIHRADADPEEMLAGILRWKEEHPNQPYLRHLADGRVIAVRFQRMANGGWVSTFEDVTARERAAQELQEQHRRFDVALSNMAHGLCMIDAGLRIIVCNRRYVDMFGMSPEVVKPGIHMRDVFAHSIGLGNHPGTGADEMFLRYREALGRGETVMTHHLANGCIVRITYQTMPQGGFVAIYEDVTERHKAEQSIAHMARHDALTDLPNRVLFREKMAEGLARVEANGEALAVLCLDLDNFKSVNDTFGHPIGDKLLRTIAERLGRAVEADDTIARLGGDEFAVLQAQADGAAAETLANRIIALVAEPILIDGHEINSGVSIGVAVVPDDGTTADHLMKCADLALYRAKAEGRNTFRFFEPDMDARIRSRRMLELDLRRALAAGEFSLAYQPQIDLATNELIAMEALLRWSHPERGPVAPSEFIPIAEDIGFIVPLGEWVLRQACAEAARWPEPIRIAVNLSPVQFRNRGLITTVTQALAAARLAPQRLELEITEAVLLQEDEAVVATLHQLRALGVRISMDDFGTGYSSLSYLRSFPFDKIKIDRSFISDLGRSRDSAAIVRAIANLGASLGIETTAEGIETDEQLELVRRAGCTGMQGYLTSPPRPAADVPALIARLRGEEAAA